MPKEVATAIARGAFEFQGQKGSAASRAYIPGSTWSAVKEGLLADLSTFKMGTPEDMGNFINAVIDERAFDKIAGYIDWVKTQDDAEIIAGGSYDKSVGYFIEPTVVVTTNPKFRTMVEEIFGPVLTIFVYEDEAWEEAWRGMRDEHRLTRSRCSAEARPRSPPRSPPTVRPRHCLKPSSARSTCASPRRSRSSRFPSARR